MLEAFAPETARLGNTEIAQRTGLSRPTVARLTHTLAELGYLAYEPSRAKFRLWARALTLAHPLLASMTLRQRARPLMQELANSVRGTVSIGLLDGTSLVYVESARAAETVAHTPDIGSTIPLPQAAMGRALLSLLDADELASAEKRFAAELPEIWRACREKVRDGMRQCEARGFCVSYGDWVSEIHAAAVPLFRDPDFGSACFALNCGMPAFRLRPGELEAEIGPRLVLLAKAIRNVAGRGDDTASPTDRTRAGRHGCSRSTSDRAQRAMTRRPCTLPARSRSSASLTPLSDTVSTGIGFTLPDRTSAISSFNSFRLPT